MESVSTNGPYRWPVPAAITLLVALISGTHIGSGIATHGDSRQIIDLTVPAILSGHYLPARSWGNPLYEYLVAWLFPTGGVSLTSAYSFMLAIASIWVANALIGPAASLVRRALVLAALCFNPLFLINAFAISEWMQATFLVLCLLWFAHQWFVSAGRGSLFGLALVSVLLVLTRPDAAIVCACLTLALLWHLGLTHAHRAIELLAAMVAAGIVTVAAFWWVNHGLAFIATGMLWSHAPISRRLIVAIVGVYSAFGVLAPLILVYAAGSAIRRSFQTSTAALSLWMKLFVLAAPLVFVRFVLMPDKLEYILILLALATAMVGNERLGVPALAFYALSSILPSVVTLSLFERTGHSDALTVHPHIGPGAVAQDVAAMRYNWRLMHDPAVLQSLGDDVYGHESTHHPRVYSENWAAGLLSDSDDLIIGDGEAYHLDNPRSESKYERKLYHQVFVCDREVWVNGSFGWRIAQPPLQWAISKPGGPVNVTCRPETG